ncbi:MAG: hypothetical protein AAB834_06780, partial [Patescibacteria group bacterium]
QYAAPQPTSLFEAAPSAESTYTPVSAEARPLNAHELPLQQRPEAQSPTPAPNPEQSPAEAFEPYALRPHQHVEHSAWHNIVVDERGREVTGAINYGEGFQRERQQEVLRDRMGDGGVTGGVAGQQSQYTAGQGSPYPGALPSGMTTPALPQGSPTHADPQHQLEASKRQAASNMTNPWFWIMLLLIIAAFFTAALV